MLILRIFQRYLLFASIMALIACGSGVTDHFSQDAPEAPVIEISVDEKNKWSVSLETETHQIEFYWADNASLTNPEKVSVDQSNGKIDIKTLLGDSVQPGETVYILIVDTWQGKPSPQSNVVEYIVQPDEPKGLKQVSLTGSSEINWSKASIDEKSVLYNIYWSTSSSVNALNNEGAATNLSNPFFLHDLSDYEDQQTLYYVIYRVQNGVESSVSETLEVVVNKTSPLDAPENFQAVINGNKIDLSWSNAVGATEYRIYRSTEAVFDLSQVLSIPVSTTDYNDLVPLNVDFYYWVVAISDNGSSENSTPVGPVSVIGSTATGNALPKFTINDEYTIRENEAVITNLTAIDTDSNNLTFSIANGNDIFQLVNNQLQFKQAPDYETDPHSYVLTVVVSDIDNRVEKSIAINIVNKNEPPVFNLLQTSFSIDEESTLVTNLVANDVDSADLIFSVADASTNTFRISSNNELQFINPPDADATDAIINYKVIISVKDEAGLDDSLMLNININAINEAPIFDNTFLPVSENKIVAGRIAALDPENDAINFRITGGADATLFVINELGDVSFINAPDYENPQDQGADNKYEFQAEISDAEFAVLATIFIDVGPTNELPVWEISTNIDFVEGPSRIVTTLSAKDPDMDTLFYSIKSGDDASFFQIDAQNRLAFKQEPDFEFFKNLPANPFNLTLLVTDNNDIAVGLNVVVTLLDVDEAAIITSAKNISILEPAISVLKVIATDPESRPLNFSITTDGQGGNNNSDSARFIIDRNSGQLSFVTENNVTDFETMTSASGDKVFEIEVIVEDTAINGGTPNITRQAIQIQLLDTAEPPIFVTGSNLPDHPENTVNNMLIEARDGDGDSLTWIIFPGGDSALFNLVPTTTLNQYSLSFKSAPDFENRQDSNLDNTYEVTLSIADAGLPVLQNFFVNISDVNEKPIVRSTNLVMSENKTDAGKVDVYDPEDSALTYTKVGGIDASLLTVNKNGNILFIVAPDFENPLDANVDNQYEISIKISDGQNEIVDTFIVQVGTANEPPVWTTPPSVSVEENTNPPVITSLSADDPENDQLTFNIINSPVSGFFNIQNGNLLFNSAIDFESSVIKNNNPFSLTLQVTDGLDSPVFLNLDITILDQNEKPVITSPASASINEPDTFVMQVVATDPENQPLIFAISDNTGPANIDRDVFEISPGGVISFNTVTDFETMSSDDGDNLFGVEIEVSDATAGNTTTQALQVELNNVNELPYFVTTVIADQTEGNNPDIFIETYDDDSDILFLNIQNVDDFNDFDLSRQGGSNKFKLKFKSIPDYENPTNNDLNNKYQLTLELTGGGLTKSISQSYNVSVININDNVPEFNTSADLPAISENTTFVSAINISDADGSLNPLTVVKLGGDDAALFKLQNTAGAYQLSFNTAPDFEKPLDVGLDNVYNIRLQLSDTSNNVPQDFSVKVSNELNGLSSPAILAIPLAGKTGASGKVILKWPAVSGASGYRLYYATEAGITPENFRTKSGGTRSIVAIGNSDIPKILNGLSLGVRYYFVITAEGSGEESIHSNEKSAMPYIPTAPLNDTGVMTCATNTEHNLPCKNSNQGTLEFSPQDAEHGRDKINSGFSFSKLDTDGNVIAVSSTSWNCVKDNVTGLIWEVKTLSGLHNTSSIYTWYNTDTQTNGDEPGVSNPSLGVCASNPCDTQNFADTVNAQSPAFCGSRNWRMPTVAELYNLTNFSIASNGNLINTIYFPNNQTNIAYWTGDTALNSLQKTTSAFYVRFDKALYSYKLKLRLYHIRLVSDTP